MLLYATKVRHNNSHLPANKNSSSLQDELFVLLNCIVSNTANAYVIGLEKLPEENFNLSEEA